MFNLNNIISQFVVVRSFFVLRNALKIAAVLIAVSCYYLFFQYNYPSDNFISMLCEDDEEYSFYSGEKADFYHDIGVHLAKEFQEGESFSIKNESSKGSLDNINAVMSDPKSMGLSNEVVAPIGDFSREQARFVAPLYTEYMYIFYRKAAFPDKELELRANPDSSVINFLKKARINGGPHGSGTRLLTSYILASMNNHDHLPLLDLGIDSAISEMNGEDTSVLLDINFSIMGPNHIAYDTILNNGEFALANIDPALIVDIDSKHRLNLRTENAVYGKDSKPVTLIGSYVYFIASRSIPNGVLKDVLFNLKKNRMSVVSHLSKKKKLLLDEDFSHEIEGLKKEQRSSFYNSGILFLISTILSSMAILWFLLTFISKTRVAKHYWEIADIYKKYIPLKYEVVEKEDHMNVPIIQSNCLERVNVLTAGFDLAFTEINSAFNKYQNGGITESDYKNLQQEYHVMVGDMCDEMHRLLFLCMKRKEDVSLDTLQRYFISNFLNADQYDHLKSVYEESYVQE